MPLAIVQSIGAIVIVRQAAQSVSGQDMNVPDYVFEKDYYLMPLDLLREYINTNKHLPNILSKEETKEINIVERQNKLLEKIEELTLYIFEQDTAIKELRQQNKEIKEVLCSQFQTSLCN